VKREYVNSKMLAHVGISLFLQSLKYLNITKTIFFLHN